MEDCIKCREPLEKIQERLEKMLALLQTKQRSDPSQVFFDNQEFIQVMNISKCTAQVWRDKGMIAYSQVRSKMYYRLSDILKMIEKHHIPSKS
jgi:hypothetical protein